MSNLVIETKIVTQFFSVVTYLENNHDMNHDIQRSRTQLSPIAFDRSSYDL